MLKILCKLVSKQQSNSMLKKVKSLMRNASSYPLSNLWANSSVRLPENVSARKIWMFALHLCSSNESEKEVAGTDQSAN